MGKSASVETGREINTCIVERITHRRNIAVFVAAFSGLPELTSRSEMRVTGSFAVPFRPRVMTSAVKEEEK